MKKVIALALILTLALPSSAQRTLFGNRTKTTQTDNTAYMQGAVPEIDGKVVFTQTFSAPGKNKAELCKSLSSWASLRFMANSEFGQWNEPAYYKNLEYSAVTMTDPNAARITCTGNEEQVFSNKLLAKDYTVINYNLNLDIQDGKVTATMTNIVFTYLLTDNMERITAEEWITDKEAITKKGKLMRVSGKFRIKTIDVKDQLFKDIEETISK